jgi:hypothetical protein
VLWRCIFATHLLVILVLGSWAWTEKEGRELGQRRAEAFNVLVFGEIGYAVTTRFIKTSTFHPRALVRGGGGGCCPAVVAPVACRHWRCI